MRLRKLQLAVLLGTALGALAISNPASADSFCTTYAGPGVCLTASGTSTNNNAIAGSVVFEVSGTNLDVTLINDAGSSLNQLGGADILTAVLFNLSSSAGTLTSTGSSATLGAAPSGFSTGSLGTASLVGTSGGNIIGQNWAIASGLSAYGYNNLYSLTGTGLNGPSGGKANLCTTGCQVLDGPGWGLSPDSNAGGEASGIEPTISYFGYFTLAGLTGGLTDSNLANDLSDVVFQYGTSSDDSTGLFVSPPTSTPEPSSAMLLIPGILLVGALQWRKRQLEAI